MSRSPAAVRFRSDGTVFSWDHEGSANKFAVAIDEGAALVIEGG